MFKPHKLRKRLAEGYYELINVGLDKGLWGAQNSYKKFVIIGRSRVGSTLLRTALASHPQVIMYGEIFRIPGQVIWNPRYGINSTNVQNAISNAPTEFLDARVYRTYPSYVKAVGFKIFYYHAEQGNFKAVWPYLAENEEIIVIHNKRRNILQSHLSNKRAQQTGKWSDKARQNSKQQVQKTVPLIHLDYDELKLWFDMTKKWEDGIDSTFSSHDKIDVYYEDLAGSYTTEINRIQKFLGLDLVKIEPATKKQAKRRISEEISNYSELKEKFRHTEWIEFFED